MGAFKPIFVEPTATTLGGTVKARRQAATYMREKNENFVFTGDANLRHTPAFYVRIFNVSQVQQMVERPWVMPGKMGKLIVIPARQEGEEYSQPFIIPDIVQVPTDRAGSWEMGTRGLAGQFLAQDALNPEEPGGHWKTVKPVLESQLANEGTNLYHWGCFWDVTPGKDQNVAPDQEAVQMAVRRLQTTYNRLIDQANLLAMQGAEGIKQIGFTHLTAANYFKRSFSWNQRYEQEFLCPSCGVKMMKGASRHVGPNGCKRVFDWPRAISEGLATIEEAVAAGVLDDQAEHMGKARARKPKA